MDMDTKPRIRVPAGRQPVLDGFQNLLSGIGGPKDKGAINTMFLMDEITDPQVDVAFRSDWIARKVINIPAEDSTREWRSWQADDGDISLIEEWEKKFKVQQKLFSGLQWGRAYGGAGMFIGTGETTDLSTPLEYEKIGKDSLQFLHVLPKQVINCGQMIRDIKSQWYGRPEYYEVRSSDNMVDAGARFHPSRVIPFYGNNRLTRLNDDPNRWSDSVLQAVVDTIKSAGITSASIAHLISEAKIDIINIPDLTEILASADGEQKMTKRFVAANAMKSIINAILLDGEEKWERLQIDWPGIPDVLLIFLMIASAAADIPATRFLSQSPKGLNATGDSDIRNHYDKVGSVQRNEMTPELMPIDEVIIRSSLGKRPEEIFYNWNPLWQMTAAEKADIALKKSQAFKIHNDALIINTDALRKGLLNQLTEDAVYPGLEEAVAEFGEEPDDPGVDPTALAVQKLKMIPGPGGMPQPGARKALPKPRASDREAVRVGDAAPKPLYVRRDLSPASTKAFLAWAKGQGFVDLIDDPHVTILYSRTPVDWMEMGADDFWGDQDGELVIKKGGPRVISKFGGALVLEFSSRRLEYRHESMIARGATSDYPEYKPHVTFTNNTNQKLDGKEPYRGELRFTEEIFEDIKTERAAA